MKRNGDWNCEFPRIIHWIPHCPCHCFGLCRWNTCNVFGKFVKIFVRFIRVRKLKLEPWICLGATCLTINSFLFALERFLILTFSRGHLLACKILDPVAGKEREREREKSCHYNSRGNSDNQRHLHSVPIRFGWKCGGNFLWINLSFFPPPFHEVRNNEEFLNNLIGI